jgi:hypothetical protein
MREDAAQPRGAPPPVALLTIIADWLAENFDLPATRDLPRVELVSPVKLAAMRFRGALPDQWREDSVVDPAVQAAYQREVLGVYDDRSTTIFLPESWSGASPREVSVLVHEMVHHLQKLAGLTYECPAAREKLAYQAQDRWLERFGGSLETEFEIDKLTLFVTAGCFR